MSRGATRGVQDAGKLLFGGWKETGERPSLTRLITNTVRAEWWCRHSTGPAGQTYDQFIDQTVRAAELHGVQIIIVRKGAHVHVAAEMTPPSFFTQAVRSDLAQRLGNKL